MGWICYQSAVLGNQLNLFTSFISANYNVLEELLVFVLLIQGYLKALGMTRTAQVKKDARIGEAEARKDAGERVSN